MALATISTLFCDQTRIMRKDVLFMKSYYPWTWKKERGGKIIVTRN